MTNQSYETPLFASYAMNPRNVSTFAEILAVCNKSGPILLRAYIQICVIIFGLPANIVLLWMLVKKKKTMTPSEVLGLNIALIGILFCIFLPLDISMSIVQYRSGLQLRFIQTFSTLCYFSCPLLLTCMCLERYVAVAHPVLYMKLGKREHRVACCTIIWFLTFFIAGLLFALTNANMALILSLILDVLFVIMIVCLVGIISVLCKKGPGEGDQNKSAMKKKALKNVVAVLVPSTIIYFPMLGLAPTILVINFLLRTQSYMSVCYIILLYTLLPNAGISIGPMFYMARVWKFFSRRNNKSANTSKTTAVQRK